MLDSGRYSRQSGLKTHEVQPKAAKVRSGKYFFTKSRAARKLSRHFSRVMPPPPGMCMTSMYASGGSSRSYSFKSSAAVSFVTLPVPRSMTRPEAFFPSTVKTVPWTVVSSLESRKPSASGCQELLHNAV